MTQESLFAPEPPAQMRVSQWKLPSGYGYLSQQSGTFPSTGYRSHRNDPQTSREAEKKMVESGRLTEQQQETLEVWHRYGPGTAREIAQRSGVDYYKLQRRKNELVRAGLMEFTGKKIDGCEEFCVKINSK